MSTILKKLYGTLMAIGVVVPAIMLYPQDSSGAGPDLPVFATYSAAKVSLATKTPAGLGDHLTLKVKGLPLLMDAAAKSNQRVSLFLNGMALKDVNPEAVDPKSEELRFHLQRTDESKEVWIKLLGKPKLEWKRQTEVSVGLENSYPLKTGGKIDLIIVRPWGLGLWGLFFVVFFIIFMKYARNSAMLRNYGPGSPYSLAWTQMAFWFCLVIVSYAFIWLVTRNMNCVTESAMVLLGIGAGTALGARVIDENKSGSNEERKGWLNEKKMLLPALAELRAKPSTQEMESLIAETKQKLEAIENLFNPPSQGFLNDILNDINGVSLHRMQMLVWTIVLGFVFLTKVYQELAMPEFNGTLLALIGISSGTYLGFKVPEKH